MNAGTTRSSGAISGDEWVPRDILFKADVACGCKSTIFKCGMMSVCPCVSLSVCLLAYLRNHMSELH